MAKSDWTTWMTVFGLLIDHRMLLFLRRSQSWAILPYHSHLSLMYLGLSILLSTVQTESAVVGALFQGLIISCVIGFRFWSVQNQEDRLRQSFQGWLENLLLRMKMGASFRSSFRFCLEKCSDGHLKTLLARQEVRFQIKGENLQPTPFIACSAPFFREIFQRMAEIEAIPHRAQVRLESLINIWRQELWFRRRSRQVLRQSHVQLCFLGLMYMVLGIWSAGRYPWTRFWPSLKLSMILIFCGVILIFLLFRRRSWKI